MQDSIRQSLIGNNNWSSLWDQTELVSAHTQKGIDFLERYGQFLKERAVIEEEYASKIRNLVKKNRNKKNDEEDCKLYSYMSAYYTVLSELDSLAAQHEVIGEKLKREVVPNINEKAHTLRANRKKHCAVFQALIAALHEAEETMFKTQKIYIKAFREAEIAYVKHDKAEKNMELSRLDLEKAKNNVHQKNQICEQAKQSYAHSLELANHVQHDHYNSKLPNLLDEMRKLDIDRIESTKQAMLQSINAETSVSNILQRCYEDMTTAICSINAEKDTMVVVEEHKSGFAFPQEHAFEDLGCPSKILVSNGESTVDGNGTLKRSSLASAKHGKNANGRSIPRKSSMHQRFFGSALNAKSNLQNGLTDGYGKLPPQQRCRKIQSNLDELAKETMFKEQSKAGLERMLGVYRENPKMGNASDVEQQIQQTNKELNFIAEKIERYKKLLLDAQSELNTPLGSGQDHNQQQQHNSLRSVASYNSPRVHSTTASLGFPSTGGTQKQRSSYSEESVSSEGSFSMHNALHQNLRSSINSTLTSNLSQIGTSNGINSKQSTISSAKNAFLNMNTINNNNCNTNNNIHHIDSNSADFYEECDTIPATSSVNAINSASNNEKNELTQTEDGIPILGTCTALYAFEGSTDGTTIAMCEGDKMLLLERDEGDGWTRVRQIVASSNNTFPIEGFVPTTYLECQWYSMA